MKPKSLLLWPYIILISTCFLFFNHQDINHTFTSSYAFLNGHIADFYEYNKPYFGRNDYLPIMYILFAIWEIPLHVLNLASNPENWIASTPIEIAWSKLLIILFFFASSILVNKIATLIQIKKPINKFSINAIYLTSPIAIFIIFIFSQYDIFGIFFSLFGVYFYLKKRWSLFLMFFSIAISFKFFALIIFVPLVLLTEKNIKKIIFSFLIGASFTALQLLLYWHSEVFRSDIFFNALTKISHSDVPKLSTNLRGFIGVFLYAISCLFFYIKKLKNQKEINFYTILIPIISYGIFYLSIGGNPQWKLLTIPYMSLFYIFIKNKKIMAIFDFIGMISFVWICVNYWHNNVDYTMINNGVLRSYISTVSFSGRDLMPRLFFLILFKLIFYAYLFSPLLLYYYEKNLSKIKQVSSSVFFIRYFLGICIFLIPAFVSTLL